MHKNPLLSAWLVPLCLLIWGTTCLTAFAHPFHLCVGQMKWNQKAGAWEVSLRLHPQDLEAAMTSDLFRNDPSKKVSAEDRNFPELAQKYLSQCFFIRRTPLAMSLEETMAALTDERSSDSKSNQAGEIPADRSTLKWVGTEQEKGWLWIHFEMKPPETKKGEHKLWLVHRVLLEHVVRQENTVSIDPAVSSKFALQFKKGEDVREMTSPK